MIYANHETEVIAVELVAVSERSKQAKVVTVPGRPVDEKSADIH